LSLTSWEKAIIGSPNQYGHMIQKKVALSDDPCDAF